MILHLLFLIALLYSTVQYSTRRKKTLETRERTSKKLNPHIASTGRDLNPCQCERRVLTPHRATPPPQIQDTQYSGISNKRTPSEREKGVRSWNWPLRECKNTEFLWELRKQRFVEVAIRRAFRSSSRLRESVRRAYTVRSI